LLRIAKLSTCIKTLPSNSPLFLILFPVQQLSGLSYCFMFHPDKVRFQLQQDQSETQPESRDRSPGMPDLGKGMLKQDANP
jgi:hypothetical protein